MSTLESVYQQWGVCAAAADYCLGPVGLSCSDFSEPFPVMTAWKLSWAAALAVMRAVTGVVVGLVASVVLEEVG